jgi:hypothetical protein
VRQEHKSGLLGADERFEGKDVAVGRVGLQGRRIDDDHFRGLGGADIGSNGVDG